MEFSVCVSMCVSICEDLLQNCTRISFHWMSVIILPKTKECAVISYLFLGQEVGGTVLQLENPF